MSIGTRESNDSGYRRQVDPLNADKRNRVIPDFPLRRLVLALDVARNEVPFKLRGDFLFADRSSTGLITVKLNSTSEDPMPFAAQDSLEELPIEDVLISHAAQAGLIVNLWYGYAGRLRANSQALSSIGSITNPVQVRGDEGTIGVPTITVGGIPVITREVGYAYGVAFNSNTAGVAGTSSVILAPGSNVNGVIVWSAENEGRNTAAEYFINLSAHTSAPNNITTGDVLCSGGSVQTGASNIAKCQLTRPVFVPAGKGLYRNTNSSEATSYFSMRYTIL